jgi:hypothetical protein
MTTAFRFNALAELGQTGRLCQTAPDHRARAAGNQSWAAHRGTSLYRAPPVWQQPGIPQLSCLAGPVSACVRAVLQVDPYP